MQQPQQHIPIRGKDHGPRRDTVTVHDTVYRLRTETLTVYVPPMEPMPFDSFFVKHDTTRDTLRSHLLVPLPIPYERDRIICAQPAGLFSTATPEPTTFSLVVVSLLMILAYNLFKDKKPK